MFTVSISFDIFGNVSFQFVGYLSYITVDIKINVKLLDVPFILSH